jgi:predicted esterase
MSPYILVMTSRRPSRSPSIVFTAVLCVMLLAGRSAPAQDDLAKAFAAADWPSAVRLARVAVESRPGDPGARYNLACALSRRGDAEAAIAALRASAERGFAFVATLLDDTDLDAIRSHPSYPAVLDLVRKNNVTALETFRKKAVDAKVLLFPPSGERSRPAPLVVALHGFGGNAASFAPVWRDVAEEAGAFLAVPQAFDAAAGGGFSWGVVEQGEHLVLRAIEMARREHPIDPKRVVVTGFSQGGGMAFTVALRHPELISGAIPIAGFYDERVTPLSGTIGAPLPRFAILNGALDEEAGNNRKAARLLEAAGTRVFLKIYDGLGHDIPKDRRAELSSALRFVLGAP